ncbi:MAG: DUF1801 domain-containing protein [Thermoanaerobaculia bacterium]|nr:DUF1801 domain-containing protein [Thermoanaerobaculia bacterium]
MKKSVPAASPDAYVAALSGWQRATVERLRAAVLVSARLEEVIKWGNLVYLSNGPVLVIRAEERRVLFGFWRGQRLREIEARLKPGGKYEMATVTLHENEEVGVAVVKRLTKAAVALNKRLGDPTDI